jgi:hypothetical protein
VIPVAACLRGTRHRGTIRRECLDHVIVLNEASLYRHVKSFLAYYHESRTHLSLAKDPPEPHRALAGTRSRRCHTASWRSSPPLRAARSLNVAVLAAVPIQGQVCRFSLPGGTRLCHCAYFKREVLANHLPGIQRNILAFKSLEALGLDPQCIRTNAEKIKAEFARCIAASRECRARVIMDERHRGRRNRRPSRVRYRPVKTCGGHLRSRNLGNQQSGEEPGMQCRRRAGHPNANASATEVPRRDSGRKTAFLETGPEGSLSAPNGRKPTIPGGIASSAGILEE